MCQTKGKYSLHTTETDLWLSLRFAQLAAGLAPGITCRFIPAGPATLQPDHHLSHVLPWLDVVGGLAAVIALGQWVAGR